MAATGLGRPALIWTRSAQRSAGALDHLDLEVAPGELVAIVGPSGAGKTTLGRVLLGLTRPSGGAVAVGRRSLDDVGLDRWRALVAWAPQHPTLVPGTVAENIALGRPEGERSVLLVTHGVAGPSGHCGRLELEAP
jgi:ATP-binding cassette subfamily C protein CydD